MCAASRPTAAATQPRKVDQKRKVAAEDSSSSKRRVVAAAPGSPRPDRGGSENIEQRERLGASTGGAYDQFYEEAGQIGHPVYIPDFTADRYFGETQARVQYIY